MGWMDLWSTTSLPPAMNLEANATHQLAPVTKSPLRDPDFPKLDSWGWAEEVLRIVTKH